MPHLDLSGATSDEHLVKLWLSARPESTIRVYARVAKSFLSRIPGSVKTVTVADVVAWMDTLGGAPATRAREVSTVKSLLSFAWRTGYCIYNVGRALRCVRVPSTLHEKLVEEPVVKHVISEATLGRDQAFVRFMYASGVRISEACRLRFIDIGHGRVTVLGKGTKTRTVMVPQPVLDDLLALRRPEDDAYAHVFRSYRGRPLGVRDARDIVYRAAQKAETKLAPHWLRHAHASHSLDGGCPIHVLQQTLGHANVSTTSKYLHAKPNAGSSQYLKL
jgi:integrase/recombinase XerD